MPTTTIDERLADMHRQIDELEAKVRSRSDGTQPHVERELAALRHQEATARAAARQALDGFEEKFEQFEARLRVAQSAVAVDLAESPEEFARAVEDELRKWDAYIERLQAQAALRAASAREQVETAISDLRRRRNEVAQRLGDVRSARGGASEEQKKQLAAVRDELEQRADELSATFD